MIGMLSATLDTRPDSQTDCVPVSTNPQPVLLILHKLLPVIKVISNSYSTDAHVMQVIKIFGLESS